MKTRTFHVIKPIKKICGYPHNGYSYEYGYGYGANIYPTSRVRGSYYPYPTCPVDIPMYNDIYKVKASVISLVENIKQ